MKRSTLAVMLTSLLMCGLYPTQVTAEEPASLANFDRAMPEGIQLTGGQAVRRAPGAAGSTAALYIEPSGQNASVLRLPVAKRFELSKASDVAFSVFISPSNADAVHQLTLLALDGEGQPIYRSAATVAKNDQWVQVLKPLAAFRSVAAKADWADVRTLAVLVPGASVQSAGLDEFGVVSEPGRGPLRSPEWLGTIAFPKGYDQAASGGAAVVASKGNNEPEALTRAADQAGAAVTLMHQILAGDQPAADRVPVSLLLFDQAEDRSAFFIALGQQLGAGIPDASSPSYTILDVATGLTPEDGSLYRPSFTYAVARAALRRDFELDPNQAKQRWLVEGLSLYAQILAHDETVNKPTLSYLLTPEASPDGPRIPIQMLITRSLGNDQRVQAAAFAGYLVDQHADALPKLAADLAEGYAPPVAFKRARIELDGIDGAFGTWCQQRLNEEQFFTGPDAE